jgi:hypothetical protein
MAHRYYNRCTEDIALRQLEPQGDSQNVHRQAERMVEERAAERRRIEAATLQWAMGEITDRQVRAERARKWIMGE